MLVIVTSADFIRDGIGEAMGIGDGLGLGLVIGEGIGLGSGLGKIRKKEKQ
jgi:hypothetical protein